nr:ligase-associated DNA damage response endonuclease PdeM [Pseudochrobactrum saccharolyticum]
MIKQAHQGGADILINDTLCHLDPRGVLYLPSYRTLVVSDLHLEKGSFFAKRGMMLPPYDTLATLALLKTIIDDYQPSCVISLGDSFHDCQGASRLADEASSLLRQMMKSRQWLWIEGNHDPVHPAGLEGESMAQFRLGGLIFRHEPLAGDNAGEVAGHLHPAAKIIRQGRSVRRSCFVNNGHRLIMPAFGTYTGSLNVLDKAFRGLFDVSGFDVHLRSETRIFTVHPRFLRPD